VEVIQCSMVGELCMNWKRDILSYTIDLSKAPSLRILFPLDKLGIAKSEELLKHLRFFLYRWLNDIQSIVLNITEKQLIKAHHAIIVLI